MVYRNLLRLAPLPFQKGGRPGQVIAELAVGARDGLGGLTLSPFAPQSKGLLHSPWFSSKWALSSPLTSSPSYFFLFSPQACLRASDAVTW